MAALMGSARTAQAQAKTPAPLPALPLSVAVAVGAKGEPVVTDAWLARSIAEAQRLLAPQGVAVGLLRRRALAHEHAILEDAQDRDALGAEVEAKVINVFIVASLRDVDDPRLTRQGVRWRMRRDLRKDYVIVAARASAMTLCHELGHYFGNGHSSVVNNIMSYRRDDPTAVAFDARQGARMRAVVRGHLARKTLLPLSELADTEPAS
jgi:hypothetical protein